MKNTPLCLVAKDTKTYEFRLTKNGSAVDISGWTVYFTVKLNFNHTDSQAAILKNFTFPSNTNSQNGIGFLDLTSADTDIAIGDYYYDIKFIATDLRETFSRGMMVVVPSIRSN